MRLTSLLMRDARVRYGVGVALLAVLPMLVLGYLASDSFAQQDPPGWLAVVLLVIALVIGLLGHGLLFRYPMSVQKLRLYTGRIAAGEFPQHLSLASPETDVDAVQKNLAIIVAQLQRKVGALEVERDVLANRLIQAQKRESLGLLAAGQAQGYERVLEEIRQRAQSARVGLAQEAPVWGALWEIEQLVARGNVLTEQARIYAGGGAFAPRPVNLSASVEEIVRLLRVYRVKAPLACEFGKELPDVSADAVLLQQAVTALVIRAADLATEGSAPIGVSTGAVVFPADALRSAESAGEPPPGRYAFIAVRDAGPRLDAAARARVFDPFALPEAEARGVSLALVYGIARLHGGFVQIEDDPSGGSLFRILLPLARV